MTIYKQGKNSFRHAWNGCVTVFRSEQSFRLQSIAAFFAIALSIFLQIKRSELIIVLLLCVAVLSLEIINSVLERLLDTFKPRIHPIIKEAKDMMAAAVLLTSIFALVIGILIFYPYVLLLVLH